ncbi:hypothetical protein LTR70_007224 [Exophiala xenobiotica]|uniref:Uncharacterized protein n=1 Tax=Lithohypha guttulata TaxID=1690604 RepID=A0ABR0K734_9EURO|nr:hypothetical protein LTR24_006048 [Lithohypha guttulata]KAK5314328.1 hypothetical protein LTR70_007224 [Exophiala xenobiotica]
MPNNRLSALFDRKPRQSKSTSNLSSKVTTQYLPDPPVWRQPRRSQSRQTVTVMQDYNLNKPLPPPPAHPPPPPPPSHPLIQAQRPFGQYQHRSSTAPVLYPPDELFLKMIRRRSASARLEETRIQMEQKHDPELAMCLALASAVPPMYFDAPPEYTSPDSDFPAATTAFTSRIPGITPPETSPRVRSRGTITRFREDELFLDERLKLQIDQTMAQYACIRVTEPSPMASPDAASTIVSPMNDIDHIYLERRRQKRKAQS